MSAVENATEPSKFQIVLRYFALGLLLALLVAILAPQFRISTDSIPDEDAIAERIRPLADLELEPLSTITVRGQRTGKAVVQELCQSCHGKGLGGAPKIGDRKAWTPRIDQGLEALVQSVKDGKCSMPSKGNSDADEMELARAVVYLIWPRMRL